MGHTPGPWAMGYDPSTHEDALVSATGSVVAYAAWDGGSGCHLAFKNPADRRLIEAAPDLLAALEWLHLGKGKPVDIAAAIARATGAGA